MAYRDGAPGWRARVAFGRPERPIAFRPGAVLVPAEQADEAERPGWGAREEFEGFVELGLDAAGTLGFGPETDDDMLDEVSADTLDLIDDLRAQGLAAQPNHVVFADDGIDANPFTGNPFTGNPFTGNPFTGNPFTGNPFTGNGWPQGPQASTGERPSSARPAHALGGPGPAPDVEGWPVVLVLDTGLPQGTHRPASLQRAESRAPADEPDTDADARLDPVAGHGAFIAGIISRIAPGCRIIVEPVLSTFGDGEEKEVARVLRRYAGRVDLVNLSFGTYTPIAPRVLERAVRSIQRGDGADQGDGAARRPAVVVASAGNDATWAVPLPAGLPGVISVAALDRDGPASFSNFGPWVSACAPGSDVVSTFFEQVSTDDGQPFDGWASWSGTSFAAPHVVGALARDMQLRFGHEPPTDAGNLPRSAVARVIDAPGLLRLPMHGTVVNVS